MHAKSGLRVVLKWKIYRPDSVIAVVITLNKSQALNLDQNPYSAPTSADYTAGSKSALRCPVCDHTLSRLRLILPLARCSICLRRIRLRPSWKSSSLSTVTAVACFLSLLYVEWPGGNGPLIFGVHGLIFLALGTTWYHMYAYPALASWFGYASSESVARERQLYLNETDTNA